TAIGFGAMLVCVTLGAWMWSIPELTAMLIPLALLQTSYISARYRQAMAWGLLLRWVLPWMGLGMAVSVALVGAQEQRWMKPALGVGILLLAVRELWAMRAARGEPEPEAPRARVASAVALGVAGVVHGIYGTGGPPLVWAMAREPLDKQAFRATISLVWVVLGTALTATYLWRGQLTADVALRIAILVPSLALGVVVGERAFRHVDEQRFRVGVWGMLVVAALPLLISW
nr:sulfite exporter TauE/SafE family protein [Myxococcales bacterium]